MSETLVDRLRARLRAGYDEILGVLDDGPDLDAYVDGHVEDLHILIARLRATNAPLGWTRAAPTESGLWWLAIQGAKPEVVPVWRARGWPKEGALVCRHSHITENVLVVAEIPDTQAVWCGPVVVPGGWEKFFDDPSPQ